MSGNRRAAADGSGLTILVNPAAGRRGDDPSDELRSGLPGARVVTLDDAAELERALRDAAANARALGIMGGDGSIGTAVGVALEHDLPLLVVPGGTLNHFARDLGVESIADAVSSVQRGRLIDVDVGVIDGRPFVNTASFGSYSKLVEAREALESKVGKWPALVIALVKVLWSEDPLEVVIDGRTRRIWMIFIGNCAYDPPGATPSTRVRLDDGAFDVRIVDGSQRWARVRAVASALAGNLARSTTYTRELVPALVVSRPASERLLAADGEVFRGASDFVVEKHPTRLAVYAPQRREA